MSLREPGDLGEVLRQLATRPWEMLGRRWNYKSAVLSSLSRSSLFFTMNL